jgi:GNAT superfamily N-acetyltransferase
MVFNWLGGAGLDKFRKIGIQIKCLNSRLDSFLHLAKMVSVDPAYRGRGIATDIIRRSILLAGKTSPPYSPKLQPDSESRVLIHCQ